MTDRQTSRSISIRRATAADLPRLLPLLNATAGMPAWSSAVWAETFASPTRALWLAEGAPGDPALGFAIGSLVAGIADLETVVVSSAARRQGIGRALLAALEQWARDGGATEIELEVRASNAAAFALYTALGFTEQDRRPAYYRDPVEDAVLMSRQL